MSIDTAIRDFFVSTQSSTSIMFFTLVSLAVYALIVVALAYTIYKKDKTNFVKIIIGGLILAAIIEVIKIFTGRMRPDGADDHSFPSRHAGVAFFLAYILPVERKYKILLYSWAALIALSRLAIDAHWFSDVIVGALIGLGFAFVIDKITLKKIKTLAERVRLGPAKS